MHSSNIALSRDLLKLGEVERVTEEYDIFLSAEMNDITQVYSASLKLSNRLSDINKTTLDKPSGPTLLPAVDEAKP